MQNPCQDSYYTLFSSYRQGISSQLYPFILHQAFQHQRLLPWNNKNDDLSVVT